MSIHTLIEIRNLTKFYGNSKAIENLNLVLYPNEIVGLLGLNGAGKSTTLKILAGIIPPSSGEILVNNHPAEFSSNYDSSKIQIGYLPENIILYPELTVRDFLEFILVIKGVAKNLRNDELQRIIAKTHLENVQNIIIKNLSQGYQKRTGIAQTIAGNPHIIILDEPISGLDPKQIIEIRNLMRELSKEHTIILSSHILSEVSQSCDRVYILHKGKIIKQIQKEEMQNIEKIFMEVTSD